MADNLDNPTDEDGMRTSTLYVGSDDQSRDTGDRSLQPYIEKIVAMDPFEDVPSVGSISASGKPFTVSVDTLPPDLQRPILDATHGLPPEERTRKESELVTEAVKRMVANNRGRTGVGADALPYHKTLAEIAGDVDQIDRQIAYFTGELEAVRGHDTVTDPATGAKVAQPIMRVVGDRRNAYEAQVRDLQRQRRLLSDGEGGLGIEGEKRARAAMLESAQLMKAREEAVEDGREVARRVQERLREDRINEQVEAQVRLRRNK